MTMFTLEDTTTGGDEGAKEFSLIPAGMHLTEVVGAEVRESFFWEDPEDHSKGKQNEVSFKFIITDGPSKGRFIWGKTPTTFNNNERCKLRHWVQEIFGVDEISPGFQFELSDLVGEPVNIEVGHRSWTDKTTGLPKSAANVDNVVRYAGISEETLDDAF